MPATHSSNIQLVSWHLLLCLYAAWIVPGVATQTSNQTTMTSFKIGRRIGLRLASSLHTGAMQPPTLMVPSNSHKNINGVSSMIPWLLESSASRHGW